MNYGVPYKGSKNRIVKQLAEAIPKADVFCDLFAGGCAVTHRMMELGKFGRYIANDLDGGGVRLFKDSVDGKYSNETRWISREDFKTLRYTDPYVGLCWSFGNNGQDYLYGAEVEPWKKALHFARVFGDFSLMEEFSIRTDGSSADITAHHEKYKAKYIRWWLSQQEYSKEELDALIERCRGQIAVQQEELRQYLLRGLESSGLTQKEVGRRLGTQMQGHYFGRSQWMFPTKEHYDTMRTFMPALDKDYNEITGLYRLWQSLQRLQSLQSLQSLQRLQRLEVSFKSYDKVEIPKGSVVYCDIPYRGTDGYGMEFDHDAFYDWCRRQTELVLVSEYSMPEDRFAEVWSTSHRSNLSATANNAVTERLFVPKGQLGLYGRMMNRGKERVQLELFPE